MPETLDRTPSPTGQSHRWLLRSPHSPGVARSTLREFLRSVQDGERFTENAELVVSELVTNALVHATRPGKRIKLGLEADGEVLLIWVEDSSPNAPQPRLCTEGESGRGLLLVEALSLKWGWGPREGISKRVWSCIEPGPVVS
ncbi:ATP-binding protein [Kitasatospora kifunensis]|uniref:Anti-sigma regulatory factor (Ser/Thr protein kinase) n=1 Tax=Kitasatospora kifunensis TaxID=58351 RepID=A0A7W7QYM3_KITKI|nr:ATP-binding protein [Kitasatospora kifunensis]MBB4921536.1 anti-sigma regulatory factor (Ser/Thr protein kinase) [Kitasatospora kifunensis]